MAENNDYNGSIKIYGSMAPAGLFPLVKAKDIFVDQNTRLDKKLNTIILTSELKIESLKDAGSKFKNGNMQVLFQLENTQEQPIYAFLVTVCSDVDYYFFRADERKILKLSYSSEKQKIGTPEEIELGSSGSANTPKFEVNDNNELLVSYDNGETFELLVKIPTPEFRVTNDYILEVSYDNGGTWESLVELPQGEPGKPGNITINGTELKFFVGTKAQYDELSAEQKENLFAIITDDPEEGSLIGRINGFLDGSIPVPAAEKAEKAEILVGEEDDFILLSRDTIIKSGVVVFKLVAEGNVEKPQDVRIITEISGNGTCFSPVFVISSPVTYRSEYRFSRLGFKSIGNGCYEPIYQYFTYGGEDGKTIVLFQEEGVTTDFNGKPIGPGLYRYYYKYLLTYQN